MVAMAVFPLAASVRWIIMYKYGVLADWSKEGGKWTSVYIKW